MEGDSKLFIDYIILYVISIHTLRVEGDRTFAYFRLCGTYFNPHPPCGGWRLEFQASATAVVQFQSTPSVWRVTQTVIFASCHRKISIHTLRVEGDAWAWRSALLTKKISIHTLRVEGDECPSELPPEMWNFNPHPPCGGWPFSIKERVFPKYISIHTLRVEGDYR